MFFVPEQPTEAVIHLPLHGLASEIILRSGKTVGGIEVAGRVCSMAALSLGTTLLLTQDSAEFVWGAGFDNSHWDS